METRPRPLFEGLGLWSCGFGDFTLSFVCVLAVYLSQHHTDTGTFTWQFLRTRTPSDDVQHAVVVLKRQRPYPTPPAPRRCGARTEQRTVPLIGRGLGEVPSPLWALPLPPGPGAGASLWSSRLEPATLQHPGHVTSGPLTADLSLSCPRHPVGIEAWSPTRTGPKDLGHVSGAR